jgi:hypothetical protein
MQGYISMHIFPNNMEPGEHFLRFGNDIIDVEVVVVGVVVVVVLVVVDGGVQVYRLNLPSSQ